MDGGWLALSSVERPYLLVDVDGVLNPIIPPPDLGFETYRFRGFEVRLSSVQGRWLRDLAHWFELAWCTTWELEAPRRLGPILGLVDLPVIRFRSLPDKLPDVSEFVGTRPCAWIDDRLADAERRWAAERPAPTLLVQTDPMVGMTEDHRAELEAFGRRVLDDQG